MEQQLIQAIKSKNLTLLSTLIEQGAEINAKNNRGYTPRYEDVFKPKKIKGIQRNPETLEIETVYAFGKKKAVKKKYSKGFIKAPKGNKSNKLNKVNKLIRSSNRIIEVPNNVGKTHNKLTAYDSGYQLMLKINGRYRTLRSSRSKDKRFRFKVKIGGKEYNFNSKGRQMVILHKSLKKRLSSFGKKKGTVTRKRRTIGGSKRVSTTRKSPERSTTLYPIGTTKTGNDGNRWVIKKTSNGVKRWVKKYL